MNYSIAKQHKTDAALFERAITEYRRGSLSASELLCREALQGDPYDVEIIHLLGVILYQKGEFSAAIVRIREAISQAPKRAGFYSNLGNALLADGSIDEAIEAYHHALALKPVFPDAYFNLGNALSKKTLYRDAIAAYNNAVNTRDGYVDALVHRGIAYRAVGLMDCAIADFEIALTHNSNCVIAHINLGIAFKEVGRFYDALECYDRALAIDGTHAEAHFNRASVLYELHQPLAAIESHDLAIRYRPNYANANAGKAVALLQLGRYEEGWPLFEWRWQSTTGPRLRTPFASPLWLGDDSLKGRTILLHSEQGLGDTIQFCRYVPQVKALGARVVLAVQKPLIPILRTLSGVDELITCGTSPPTHDYHCPLLSLPLAFRASTESIPNSAPYLHAIPDDVELWRRYIGDTGFRVAISWQGNKDNPVDRFKRFPLARSFDLDMFRDIAKIKNIRLISLQKHINVEEFNAFTESLRIEIPPKDFDHDGREFLDSAAIMQSVDLVITNDSALAHLAGALGVRTWVVLPFTADWRWMLDRSDCDWYPSHQLFRPQTASDKTGVFLEITRQLRALSFSYGRC